MASLSPETFVHGVPIGTLRIRLCAARRRRWSLVCIGDDVPASDLECERALRWVRMLAFAPGLTTRKPMANEAGSTSTRPPNAPFGTLGLCREGCSRSGQAVPNCWLIRDPGIGSLLRLPVATGCRMGALPLLRPQPTEAKRITCIHRDSPPALHQPEQAAPECAAGTIDTGHRMPVR